MVNILKPCGSLKILEFLVAMFGSQSSPQPLRDASLRTFAIGPSGSEEKGGKN